jgi:VanZ family protein
MAEPVHPAEPCFRPLLLLWPAGLFVTILWASGQSAIAAPGGIPHFDKVAHFFLFGLLGTLLYRASWRGGDSGWGKAAGAVVAVSCLGVVDEVRQSFTIGRYVEFGDWVADTLGALAAVLAYRGWPLYRRVLEWPLFSSRTPDRTKRSPRGATTA